MFFQQNAFEIVVCKMSPILFRSQSNANKEKVFTESHLSHLQKLIVTFRLCVIIVREDNVSNV